MKIDRMISGILLIMMFVGIAGSAEALGKKQFEAKGRWFGPPHKEFGPGSKERINRLSHMLDLSAEQRSKLLEQDQALERDILPLRQKIETSSLDLEDELNKDNPDRAKIETKIKDINQNMLQIQLKRTDFMLKFRASLTAEQKGKMKKMVESEKRGQVRDANPPR